MMRREKAEAKESQEQYFREKAINQYLNRPDTQSSNMLDSKKVQAALSMPSANLSDRDKLTKAIIRAIVEKKPINCGDIIADANKKDSFAGKNDSETRALIHQIIFDELLKRDVKKEINAIIGEIKKEIKEKSAEKDHPHTHLTGGNDRSKKLEGALGKIKSKERLNEKEVKVVSKVINYILENKEDEKANLKSLKKLFENAGMKSDKFDEMIAKARELNSNLKQLNSRLGATKTKMDDSRSGNENLSEYIKAIESIRTLSERENRTPKENESLANNQSKVDKLQATIPTEIAAFDALVEKYQAIKGECETLKSTMIDMVRAGVHSQPLVTISSVEKVSRDATVNDIGEAMRDIVKMNQLIGQKPSRGITEELRAFETKYEKYLAVDSDTQNPIKQMFNDFNNTRYGLSGKASPVARQVSGDLKKADDVRQDVSVTPGSRRP